MAAPGVSRDRGRALGWHRDRGRPRARGCARGAARGARHPQGLVVMPDNRASRLEFTKGEIDRVFGRGYSRDHPELTAAVMLSASLDFHGLTLARAARLGREVLGARALPWLRSVVGNPRHGSSRAQV